MEMTGKEKIWVLPPCDIDTDAVAELATATGLSAITAAILYRRGYTTPESASSFLSCEDTLLHSPFLLKDVERAVARVLEAIEMHQRIVIYGDYDVDGVTSVSLLYLYLIEKGADVRYYIPSRHGEGYGLSTGAIDKLAATGVDLIITVDTGITANEEAAYAAGLGIDMVITDHHECRLPLPEAAAVVNPHRPDCGYPFKELAGVGVIFKVVCAIEGTLAMATGEREVDGVRRVAHRFADLVAIGTIADVMPIIDENRLIVKLGLSHISNTKRPGLAALIEEASAGNRQGERAPAKRKKITASFIGFGLAPRLNAAGRMSEASLAADLLLAEDPHTAESLAISLCEINRERQIEENRIAEEAYRQIEEKFDLEDTRVLVLADDGWRQGIIGIVASRVTERYGLPSIMISFDGAMEGFASPTDIGKGSGRSVKGLNLVEALADSEDLLVKFGGHELAAGLSVQRDHIDAFRHRINAYAAEHLPAGGIRVSLEADAELSLSDATMSLAEELLRLEPFGDGNPMPQFILRDLTIDRIIELGGGKHLKLLVSAGGISLFALCFSTSRARFGLREGDRVDLLCNLDINEFQNQRSVQLTVRDFKPSATIHALLKEGRARYAALRAGEAFDSSEDVIPDRTLFAHVYTVLRREFRAGNDTFDERTLLALVNAAPPRRISYVCLKYILDIFRELQICGVEEYGDGTYRFDIYFNASKTNIEKSSILKKLKSQSRDRIDGR